jgi:hypothetical protein
MVVAVRAVLVALVVRVHILSEHLLAFLASKRHLSRLL